MKLISQAHLLVLVTNDAINRRTQRIVPDTWVGFNEHGKYIGHQPYLLDPEDRDRVIDLAKSKAERILFNAFLEVK